MTDLAGSESSIESSTQALDSYLAVTASAHKLFTQFMSQVLGQLNMPTQSEITSMAGRLTNIEMRLDDLDARLDDIARAIEALADALPRATALEAVKETERTATSARRRSAGEKRAGAPTGGRSRTLRE
jgi:chromosome segregation ATPase